MAINKVVYAGNTLLDLTSDTVTADMLMDGKQVYQSNGTFVTGVLKEAEVLVINRTGQLILSPAMARVNGTNLILEEG